jgi:tRNA(Arg) A34 adenosine deaminase TadA
MWRPADAALLRCLELAHQSFLTGGLPVGAVIVAPGGEKVSVAGTGPTTRPAGPTGRGARPSRMPR